MANLKVNTTNFEGYAKRFSSVSDALYNIYNFVDQDSYNAKNLIIKASRQCQKCSDVIYKTISILEQNEDILCRKNPLDFRTTNPVIDDMGYWWSKEKEKKEIIYYIDIYGIPTIKIIGGIAGVIGSGALTLLSGGSLSEVSIPSALLSLDAIASGAWEWVDIIVLGPDNKSSHDIYGDGIQIIFETTGGKRAGEDAKSVFELATLIYGRPTSALDKIEKAAGITTFSVDKMNAEGVVSKEASNYTTEYMQAYIEKFKN